MKNNKEIKKEKTFEETYKEFQKELKALKTKYTKDLQAKAEKALEEFKNKVNGKFVVIKHTGLNYNMNQRKWSESPMLLFIDFTKPNISYELLYSDGKRNIRVPDNYLFKIDNDIYGEAYGDYKAIIPRHRYMIHVGALEPATFVSVDTFDTAKDADDFLQKQYELTFGYKKEYFKIDTDLEDPYYVKWWKKHPEININYKKEK